MKFTLLIVLACVAAKASAINWQGNWAMNCDFAGKDLSSRRVPGSQCSSTCQATGGCTHFTWTNYNGGTCWMKQGNVCKSEARSKTGAVCGVVQESCGGTSDNGGQDNIGGGSLNGGDGSVLKKGALIWSDEFDTTGSPSASKWYQVNEGTGFGNNELQFYTKDKNAYASNGNLVITSKRERYGNRDYTSAKLISNKKFKYGIFEMKAKLPRGRGTWAAFWMLAAVRPLHWPRDGEIDIMENVGFDGNKVHATIHCDKYNHVKGTQIGKSHIISNPWDQFHTYTIDWTPNYIKAYVDDQHYFTYDKRESSFEAWPYDTEFALILNTAIGGNWGGAQGIDNGAFPAYYTIDYVRQYQNGFAQ